MRIIKFFFIICILILFNNKVNSNESLIQSLKKSGNLIFIRHAYSPGNGDPQNFDILDCSTQRNLNYKGIEQSKKIGLFFKKNKIVIDRIFSSEWCRCKDTADYAFKNYKTKNFLNSFYDKKFVKNKEKQLIEINKYIKKLNKNENIVFVTHYVVISELLNLNPSSGEIIITDKSLVLLGRIKINY